MTISSGDDMVKPTRTKRLKTVLFIPIITTLMTVSGSILSVWIQQKFEMMKEKKIDIVMESVKEDNKVNTILNMLMDYYGSDRVLLFRIYKSDYNYKTTSCTNEVTSIGTSTLTQQYQKVPLSIFTDYINDVTRSKTSMVYIPDALLEPRKSINGILIDNGVKSQYGIGIWSKDGRLIGTLIIDFVKNKKVLTELQLNELNDKSKIISLFLDENER
jgi:hypothetical protein